MPNDDYVISGEKGFPSWALALAIILGTVCVGMTITCYNPETLSLQGLTTIYYVYHILRLHKFLKILAKAWSYITGKRGFSFQNYVFLQCFSIENGETEHKKVLKLARKT